MNSYIVNESERARKDIRRIIKYMLNKKRNPFAAERILDDYYHTAEKLSYMADTVSQPNDPSLQKRGLKRINFSKHDYFILFAIEGEAVIIANVFHAKENFEKKL